MPGMVRRSEIAPSYFSTMVLMQMSTPFNQLLNVVEMVAYNADAAFLFQRDFITLNRGQHILRLFLEGTMQKGNAMLWVKILIGCQGNP